MKICHTCGVTAPVPGHGQSCFVCHSPAIPDPPAAPPPPEGMCWCRLWGHFTCRSCGFDAPINFLDADGGLSCSRCGIDQAFDVSRWTSILGRAHEIADLAGPAPESRAASPDLIDVGPPRAWEHPQVYSWTEIPQRQGQLELSWACAVGSPLCGSCGAPLQLGADDQGHLVTRCGGCGQRATYGPLDDVRRLYPGVVAVLADEHRTDLADAKELEGQGAVSVACPECGAPFAASNDLLQKCDHCGATIRVPQRFRSEVAMEPFWLLFDGASPARREREEQIRRERIEAERAKRAQQEMDARREEARRIEAERLAKITCPLCLDPTLDERGWCMSCGHGKPWHVKNPAQVGLIAAIGAWVVVAALDVFVIKPYFPGIGVLFYLIMAAVGSLFLGIGISIAIDPSGHTFTSSSQYGHSSSRSATSSDGVIFAIFSAPFYFAALAMGPLFGLGPPQTATGWSETTAAGTEAQTTCAAGDLDQCLADGERLESSDPQGAVEAYGRACAMGHGAGCFSQGQVARRAGDREAAEAAWRRGCDLDHIPSCGHLAASLFERDPAAAEAPALQACQADDTLGCVTLAAVFAARDDLASAVPFAQQACQSRSAEGCADLSWYQLRNDRHIDALQAATRAVDLDASSPEARQRLAYALIAAGEEERAMEELAAAVSLERGPRGKNNRAAESGRVEEIRGDLRRLRELYPRRRRAVARVLRRQREWARPSGP